MVHEKIVTKNVHMVHGEVTVTYVEVADYVNMEDRKGAAAYVEVTDYVSPL